MDDVDPLLDEVLDVLPLLVEPDPVLVLVPVLVPVLDPVLVPGAGVPGDTRARASTVVEPPESELVAEASEAVPDDPDPPPPQATKDMLTVAINDNLKP